MRLTAAALALAGLSAWGCGSGGSKSTAPAPGYTLAVAPSATPTTLGTQVVIPVALSSTGSFAGSVALAASGVPASWGVAFTPSATVDLASGHGSATLTLTIPSDGAAAPSGIPVTIAATAPGNFSGQVVTSVTVANQYVISIAPGTGTGAHFGALAGTTLYLPVGATLVFRNDDSDSHLIHANNTIPGFQHEDVGAPLGTGQSYTSGTLSAGTDPNVYCHLHGTPTGAFAIVVH